MAEELDKSAEKVENPEDKKVETTEVVDPPINSETPIIEDKTDKPVEIGDDVIFSRLSEKMGREIKSFDDLTTEKVVEKIVEKPLEYASEQVALIDKYIRETGRSVDDWKNTQSVDFTKMSSEDLVKGDIKARFPNLTNSQVEAYFKSEFKVDEESYEEDEVAVGRVKLEMKAKEVRDHALELQAKYKLPIETRKEEVQVPKPVTEVVDTKKADEASANAKSASKQKWIENITAKVNSMEEFKVGNYNLKVDDQVKKELIQANSTMEKFWENNFKNPDGTWNEDKINLHLYLAREDNLSAVIGNIESHNQASGMEKVIENRKNIQLVGRTSQEPVDKSPSQLEEEKAFREAMLNSNK